MSASKPTVAAVLVTRNSARWIEQTLQSILLQRHQPDAIVIVDDNSTDDTRAIVTVALGDRATLVRATSRVDDVNTRIAQNFQQGVRAASAFDVAVLGDHDDIWHPNRIGHQVNQLKVHHADMIASDGRLVNAKGSPLGGTLRETFPVPGDFNDLPGAERMRVAIRQSIATGGASAVRTSAVADLQIPHGWLHDRWWSLVATARQAMRIDDDAVIDYRVSETQEVGLDRGRQGDSAAQRLRAAAGSAPEVLAKLADLRQLQALATDPAIRKALGPVGLLRALA